MWFNLHSSYGLFKMLMLLVALSSVQLTYALNLVKLNPNTSIDLQSLTFVDSQMGYNIGFMVSNHIDDLHDSLPRYSEILKSTDKGATWELKYKIDSVVLKSISFLGNNIGIAAGFKWYANENRYKGIVLKSTDGGNNWAQVLSPLFSNAAFVQLSYYKYDNLTMVGSRYINDVYQGLILKSSDMGNTWHKVQLSLDSLEYVYKYIQTNSTSAYFDGLEYSNNELERVIYKTVDSFKTWQKVVTPFTENRSFGDFDFIDQQIGLIVGHRNGNPEVYKTENSGYSWDKINLDLSSYDGLFKVKLMDKSNYIILGEDENGKNKVFHTKNSGLNWSQRLTIDSLGRLNEISLSYEPLMPFSNYAYIFGEKGLIYRCAITDNECGALTSLNDGKLEFTSYLNQASEPKLITFQVDNINEGELKINMPDNFEVSWEKYGIYNKYLTINHSQLKLHNKVFVRFHPKESGSFTGEVLFKYNIKSLFEVKIKGTTQTASIEDEILEDSFSLAPNPAENSLTIQTKKNSNSNKLEIFDVLGNKIIETMIQNNHTQELNILQSGVYFVKLNNKVKQFVKR